MNVLIDVLTSPFPWTATGSVLCKSLQKGNASGWLTGTESHGAKAVTEDMAFTALRRANLGLNCFQLL